MTIKHETFLVQGHENTIAATSVAHKAGIIFRKENTALGASYVYTKDGDTGEHAGAISCSRLTDKTFQVIATRSGATTIDVIIQGRVHKELEWCDVFTQSYAASTHEFFSISEELEQIRVGVKITGVKNATDAITIGFNFVRP